tara:strand:+ start:335 stop:700 length:366 start_codon:yes stop_codon:yes gene_type:complete
MEIKKVCETCSQTRWESSFVARPSSITDTRYLSFSPSPAPTLADTQPDLFSLIVEDFLEPLRFSLGTAYVQKPASGGIEIPILSTAFSSHEKGIRLKYCSGVFSRWTRWFYFDIRLDPRIL